MIGLESWTEKYRPKKIEDVVGNKISFEMVITNKKKNLLLHGSPGTGKSSAVRALLRNFEKDSIFVVDARMKSSPQKISNALNIFLKKKIDSKIKCVIVDEVDSLNLQSQKLFVKPLSLYHTMNNTNNTNNTNNMDEDEEDEEDEENEKNEENEENDEIKKNEENTEENELVFIFICNNIHKISNAILKKTLYVPFKVLSFEEVEPYLKHICKTEKIQYNTKTLNFIFENCDKDLRKVVLYLQHMYILHDKFTVENFNKMTLLCKNNYCKTIETWKKNYNNLFDLTDEIYYNAYSITDLSKYLVEYHKIKKMLTKPFIKNVIKTLEDSKTMDDNWFAIFNLLSESPFFMS